jgi:hypothetical protein
MYTQHKHQIIKHALWYTNRLLSTVSSSLEQNHVARIFAHKLLFHLSNKEFPHTSKPTLGPTQPPVLWVLSLSRG